MKIAEQVLINKRSREHAEAQRVTIKKKLSGSLDLSNRVAKFVDCRTKDISRRELYIVEGDSPWAPASRAGTRSSRALCRCGAKF